MIAFDPSASHSSLVDVITSRRSIRRYAQQSIPREVVTHLLQCAVAAPSAHNRQPWRFVVLTDVAAKQGLAQAMGAKLKADRLRDADALHDIEADVARSYARLTQAPVLIVVCMTLEDMDRYGDAARQEAERVMAIQSTAMAVQNLLLAAQAQALGACWMCAPLFCDVTVRESLSLPFAWEPQAIVTLGYPAQPGKPFTRRPLREVVRFSGDAP